MTKHESSAVTEEDAYLVKGGVGGRNRGRRMSGLGLDIGFGTRNNEVNCEYRCGW